MPTDMVHAPSASAKFALSGVMWSLGLFGVLRLPWIETSALFPVTWAQAAVATSLFGAPTAPIDITLACSGIDAVALCLGAVLAYPATWRARVAGAGGGVVLILVLNTLRIGTLGRAAASEGWFNALHIWVWPAALTFAVAGYVFAWMRVASAPALGDQASVRRGQARAALPRPSRQFIAFTVGFLLLFSLASPFYLQSASVLALAAFVARAAAAILHAIGVSANATDSVLWTSRGGFLVTPECIATPLIPVYLAGLVAWSPTRKHVLIGVVATLPIFTALGIARLLVVALPAVVVDSPVFLVHAFFQLLLGAVVVLLVALWRHEPAAAVGRTVAGILLGVLIVRLLGPVYTWLMLAAGGGLVDDPQRAIEFLPVFQVGLYVALSTVAYAAVAWRRLLAGLALLWFTQMIAMLVLRALAGHPGLTLPVSDVRAWAVAGPLLIVALVVNRAQPRR